MKKRKKGRERRTGNRFIFNGTCNELQERIKTMSEDIEKRREYMRKYMRIRRKLGLSKPPAGYENKMSRIKRYGSIERYNEALMKYEGECAFACGKNAELVHHVDGKSYRNSPKEEANNNLQSLLPLCRSCHRWLHGTPKGEKNHMWGRRGKLSPRWGTHHSKKSKRKMSIAQNKRYGNSIEQFFPPIRLRTGLEVRRER